MRRTAAQLLVGAALLALPLSGCGAGDGAGDRGSGSEVLTLRRTTARALDAYFERLRGAVVGGARRDFARGTGIGGPGFEACVRGLLRKALDRTTLAGLARIYRMPDGRASAAQALNRLAAPPAARCGHRSYVPELVEAARGLGRGRAFAR